MEPCPSHRGMDDELLASSTVKPLLCTYLPLTGAGRLFRNLKTPAKITSISSDTSRSSVTPGSSLTKSSITTLVCIPSSGCPKLQSGTRDTTQKAKWVHSGTERVQYKPMIRTCHLGLPISYCAKEYRYAQLMEQYCFCLEFRLDSFTNPLNGMNCQWSPISMFQFLKWGPLKRTPLTLGC